MSTILVTGATGNVGSRLVKRLAENGHTVRAFARDAERVAGRGVDAVPGDFADPAALQQAMQGVDAVYLLATGERLAEYEANAIDAAKAAGVGLIVKHSVAGAPYKASDLPRWHREGEERIEASGLPYVFLRPATFASNALFWAPTIKGQNAVYGALGDTALPVIDPSDIADAAYVVLTTPGHAGKAYELSGPEALTTAQQVDQIGNIVGRDLKFINVSDDAAKQGMLGMGMPPRQVEAMIGLIQLLRGLGRIEPYPGDVTTLTGHPPRTFRQWAQDHAQVFQ